MRRIASTLLLVFMMSIFNYFAYGSSISNSDSDSYSNSNSQFPLAPALYVFGDSLLDNGNNNMLPTIAKANFKPYGSNFADGATGRFTNGKTVADFISEYIGLPFSEPSLSARQTGPSGAKTGLNFASAGCGILPETGNYFGKCTTFEQQLDLFQSRVEKYLPQHLHNLSEISNYLSKSIFIVGIGNNDYINNYLISNLYPTSHFYDPQSFATHLIDKLSQHLQRLYKLGGRKMVVFEIGPIGCIPSTTRTKKQSDGKKCVEEINNLALIFNSKLQILLQNLTSSLNGSNFIFGQVYNLSYDAIMNPSNYGLKDSSNPCCVSLNKGRKVCVAELQPCSNVDEHVFWDGYHLTQIMYSKVSALCINNSSFCSPMNIKELVQV